MWRVPRRAHTAGWRRPGTPSCPGRRTAAWRRAWTRPRRPRPRATTRGRSMRGWPGRRARGSRRRCHGRRPGPTAEAARGRRTGPTTAHRPSPASAIAPRVGPRRAGCGPGRRRRESTTRCRGCQGAFASRSTAPRRRAPGAGQSPGLRPPGAVAVALIAGSLARGGPDGEGAPSDAAQDACATGEGPAADVDGDGCPERLAVDGNRVSAGEATWEVGDRVTSWRCGDWDCDGSATLGRPPARHRRRVRVRGVGARRRPGDGHARPGRCRAASHLRVEAGDGGCDALVVEAADGASTVVAEARA